MCGSGERSHPMRKVKDNRQALPALIASKSEIGAILAHLTALTSDHAARLRMQGPGPMPEH
jgi:antitoxin component HigA of HigAB toxin-antitoxin module